jgi:hypothetical protein
MSPNNIDRVNIHQINRINRENRNRNRRSVISSVNYNIITGEPLRMEVDNLMHRGFFDPRLMTTDEVVYVPTIDLSDDSDDDIDIDIDISDSLALDDLELAYRLQHLELNGDIYHEMMDVNPIRRENPIRHETQNNYMSGFPKDSIETKTDLDITCTICQDVFRNPVIATCGHIFCDLCIKRALTYKNECPTCKHMTTPHDLRNIPIIKSYIDTLQIKCPNDGCNWKNKIELYKQHENNCIKK